MEIEEDVTGLDEDVGFLFDEQVIQDERLLNLETSDIQINEQIDQVIVEIDSKCNILWRIKKILKYTRCTRRIATFFSKINPAVS